MIFKRQYILVFLISLSLLSFCSGADELATAEDINSVIVEADEIINRFRQGSFELRMRYEFAGKFITEGDRLKLLELSQNAADKLDGIIKKQAKLRKVIDEYEGADWEKQYGGTNLWRRLDYSYYRTLSGKCLTDSYRALTSDRQKRGDIIQQVGAQIEKLNQNRRPDIAKARALALIARLEPRYKDSALKELATFKLFSDVYRPTAAAIEEMKLLNKADPEKIQSLIKTIEQNFSEKYQRLFIQLAIHQRKCDFNGYIETMNRYFDIKAFLCQLLCYSLLHDSDFEINTTEAEMFADFTLGLRTNHQKNKKYAKALEILYQKKSLRTPLTVYALAQAVEKDRPRESVELLLEASRLRKQNPDPKPDIDANEAARRAILAAYEMYRQDPNYVEFAAKTFREYKKLAEENIDQEIEWRFAQMYVNDFDAAAGYDILRDIQKKGGEYSKKAGLYLAAQKICHEAYVEPSQRPALLQQFAENLSDGGDCVYESEAIQLVEDTVNQIENFVSDANIIRNCRSIAEFFIQCSEQPKVKLLLAETMLICQDNKQLKNAKKLIDESKEDHRADKLQLARCQARLSQETGGFDEAALLWGKIAVSLYKAKENGTTRWRRYRAQYYQLYCAYKAGEKPADIAHAIKVLKATHTEIPAPWAEKLAQLQQNLILK